MSFAHITQFYKLLRPRPQVCEVLNLSAPGQNLTPPFFIKSPRFMTPGTHLSNKKIFVRDLVRTYVTSCDNSRTNDRIDLKFF